MMDQEMIIKLQETTDRSIRNEGRIKKLESEHDMLHELVTSVSNLATRQGYVESDVKEIKTDVKALASKPGKRWDSMTDKALWAVLAAIIAFLLGRIGL